jgi:hypothetical protein
MATGTPPNFNDLEKQIKDLNQRIIDLGGGGIPNITAQITAMGGSISSANAFIKLLTSEVNSLENVFSNISTSIKEVLRDLGGAPSITSQVNKGFNKLESIAQKLADHKKDESILTIKQIKLNQKKAIDEINNLNEQLRLLQQKGTLTPKEAQYQNELTDALANQTGYLHQLNKESQTLLETEQEIQKTLGITGHLYKGISATLQKIGIESDVLEEISLKMRKAAKDGTDSFGVLKIAIKETGKAFKESLSDPVARFAVNAKIFNFVFDKTKAVVIDIDAAAGDMAKSIGVSYDSALKLNERLRDVAVNTATIGVNFKELAEAQKEFSTEFGTYNQIAKENLITQSQLTKLVGLQGDEGIKIFKTSALRGVNEKKFVEQIYGANAALNMQNKTFISEKAVLKEIATTSNAVKMSIKGGTEGLVKSVQEATKLGLSLNKIDGIAGSLLNFEQSITAELEAELVTGQDLNLEQARYYALTNDTNGLIREINKQGITATKFANMNRIAQEKTAAALGMSREEMADMFSEQESLNQLKKTAGYQDVADLKAAEAKFKKRAEEVGHAQALAELGESEFKDKQKTLSAQESMNDAMIKLGDAVKSVIDGPLGKMLKMVNSLIQAITSIPGLNKAIGWVVAGGMATAGVVSLVSMGKSLMDVFRGKRGDTRSRPTYVEDVNGGGGGSGGSGSPIDDVVDDLSGNRNASRSGSKGGLKRIGQAFKKGGLKGGFKSLGRMGKGLVKEGAQSLVQGGKGLVQGGKGLVQGGKGLVQGATSLFKGGAAKGVAKGAAKGVAKGAAKGAGTLLKGAAKGVGSLIKGVGGELLAPITSVAQTGKGLYDFFADKKLRDTGMGGFMESLGGTGAGILDSLTFGLSKAAFNAAGVSIPGMDTDDVASARAIFHKSGRDPDDSRSPMSLDNKQLIQDILANPDAYPEGIVEQATGVDIKELKLGGLVTQSGIAKVDAGEVYLGGNSLGVLKSMLDAMQEQNNHLKNLLSKNQNIYLDSTKVGTAFSLNT